LDVSKHQYRQTFAPWREHTNRQLRVDILTRSTAMVVKPMGPERAGYVIR